MKPLMILITLMTFLSLPGFADENTVPRLIDDDGPSLGVKILALEELWRIGGEDEDVIFGRIVDVERHPNGEVYILDNQMCHVVVISDNGEHLRDLSRQGDGPGELRQPMGLVFLPDDILGIGMGFPGKMVTLKLDGTPVDSRYPIGEPVEGNVGVMISIQGVDGVLVASGGRLVFANEGESHTMRFLSVTDYQADNFNRILEKTTPMDPTGLRFVEADAYYIDRSWVLGPQGKIYAPMKRDSYEVSVFDKTGKLLGEFGRQNNPRKRTQDDKDDVNPLINVAGRPEGRDWDIADHDECVSRILFNQEENTIWVLTPHGSNDQPEGILETWDVFGTDGQYLQQVAIPLGDEMNDGTCYLVGGSKLVVVKGTSSSFDGDENPEDEEEETEVEPLEVICYEMR